MKYAQKIVIIVICILIVIISYIIISKFVYKQNVQYEMQKFDKGIVFILKYINVCRTFFKNPCKVSI